MNKKILKRILDNILGLEISFLVWIFLRLQFQYALPTLINEPIAYYFIKFGVTFVLVLVIIAYFVGVNQNKEGEKE